MRRLSYGAKVSIVTMILAIGANAAQAGSLPVVNPSFELTPPGGLPDVCLGGGCFYKVNGAIPGWNSSGAATYELQPGVQTPFDNYTYHNSVPAGITIGGVEGGALSQTLAATSVAGDTYTLSVYTGRRKDCCLFGPVIQLKVGGATIDATGAEPAPGDWALWTATYTANTSGLPLGIVLTMNGVYTGNGATTTDAVFDAVSVTALSGTPEPAAWATVTLGLGLAGGTVRRRRQVFKQV